MIHRGFYELMYLELSETQTRHSWHWLLQNTSSFELFSYIQLNCYELSILYDLYIVQASLVAQLVKSSPAVWETWVQSLGWEDLEKGKTTYSTILAWRIPWTKESGKLQSMGSQKCRTWLSNFPLHIFGKISSCCTWKYKLPTTSVCDLWLAITEKFNFRC